MQPLYNKKVRENLGLFYCIKVFKVLKDFKDFFLLQLRQDRSPLVERPPHVDNPLVAAAAKTQRQIAFGKHEPPVHQHIHVFEQRTPCGIPHDILEQIARIAPYRLVGTLLNHARERRETLRAQHRVAAAERYVHIGFDDEVEYLPYRHFASALRIPRLRIVAPHATVLASGAVNRCTQTDTVHGRAVDDVENADCFAAVITCGQHGR